METIKGYAGVVALVILAIMGGSAFLKSGSHLAGSTACSGITCLAGGLRLVSDLGGDFETDVAAVINSTLNVTGATTLGGALTITTTNTATSTISVGCIQTTATSTLTPIKLSFGLPTYATTTFTKTGAGLVAWSFGTCP